MVTLSSKNRNKMTSLHERLLKESLIYKYILKHSSVFAIIFVAIGLYNQTIVAPHYLELKTEKTLDQIEQKIDVLINCTKYSTCSTVDIVDVNSEENERRAGFEKVTNFLGKLALTLGILFLVMGEILRNRKE